MSLLYDYIVPALGFVIPVATWYLIGNTVYYYNNDDFKIARNITSSLHALSVILFYQFSLSVLPLFYLSRGYYLMDTLYELVSLKSASSIKLFHLGMLLHHIVTILSLYYLINPATTFYLYYSYFLAELSNLPMYVMRHLHSINITNKYIVTPILLMEFLAYIIFRMIMCVPIMYAVFLDTNVPIQLKSMTFLMYGLSGFWTYKLFGQIHHKLMTSHKKVDSPIELQKID